MEKKAGLLKFLKSKKFLWGLALFVLLIVSVIFWVTGVSRKSDPSQQGKSGGNGLNPELPKANFKEDKSPLSKLSYYEKADRDTARRNELKRNDPYYKQGAVEAEQATGLIMTDPVSNHSYRSGLKSYKDPNEEKVYSKLAELNKHLNQSVEAKADEHRYAGNDYSQNQSLNNKDVDRLESMMQSMKHSSKSNDPQMQELNSTLDKILDVQHPERVKERAPHSSVKNNKVMHAKADDKEAAISLLQGKGGKSTGDLLKMDGREGTGFYGIDGVVEDKQIQNAIAAAIHETQTLVNGAVVKLRLLQDIDIQGQVIGNGQLIYGIASLNNERLNIEINSVRFGNTIFPLQLKVYDLDGMEGLYIPGAISRDVAKQSAENSVQSIGLMTMDHSLPAQAAAAGINAAKSLLTKKLKLVKVTVKEGYQVLLKDNSEINN